MKKSRSVLKNIRKSACRRKINTQRKRTLKGAIKHIQKCKTKKEALKAYPAVQSMIDRSIQDGLIKKNRAARLKSRLLKRVAAKG